MRTIISNVSYFDGETGSFQQGSIGIENGTIVEIGSDLDGDRVIEGTGKYLVPGLIDSHIHFFQSGGLFTRPDGLDLRHIKSYEQEVNDIRISIPQVFKRYLATGITGVVDCGGPFWNFDVLKESEQTEVAPAVAVAGPLVSTVSREKLDLGDPPIIKATSEDHARELVRKCTEKEPAFVKLWFIYQQDRFDEDSNIMTAAIDETHRQGYRAAVHATELETARRAVELGADILVHSVFNEEVDDEFVDLLVANDVIYIPTLMVRNGYRDVYHTRLFLTDYEQRWGDPSIIQSYERLIRLDSEEIPDSHRELRDDYDKEPEDTTTIGYHNLMKVHEAGVTVATGTDAGNVGTLHGPALMTEMDHMVKAGMNPEDVIIATTKNGAMVLGDEDVGLIQTGYRADLVLLNANPLEDITNMQSIHTVVRFGTPYSPEELITPFDPVSVVQGQLEAYNARDIDQFLSYYHPRVKIFDQRSGELLMEGLDQMRERYTQLFADSPELQATVVNRIVLGSLIVDHEEVTGHFDRDFISAIAYYEVRHQKITKVWFGR